MADDGERRTWWSSDRGLGITDVGKVYGRSVTDFALDAVQRALADCGLAPSDVDGLVTSYGMSGAFGNVPAALGLRNLGLNVNMFAAGATASAAIQYAAMAVARPVWPSTSCMSTPTPHFKDPSLPSGSSYATGQRTDGYTNGRTSRWIDEPQLLTTPWQPDGT